MDAIVLIARLALAGIFAVAGIAKLRDLPGSRRAVAGFGVPERFAAPLGLALPLAELAVALALLPTASARWGGLGALALTLVFIAAIGINLAQGRAPDCHCFGQLHSEPAGWSTIGRNAALAVVAAFVLWQGWNDPQFTTASWFGDRSAAELLGLAGGLLLVAVVAVGAWLLVGLVGQNGRLLVRIEALEATVAGGAQPSPTPEPEPDGLPAGMAAPTFAMPDLTGSTVTLDALREAGKNVVLLFSDPGCSACTTLLPSIATWQRDYGEHMTIAVVSRGTAEANRHKLGEHAIAPVLLQQDREVARAYRVDATPSAVVVMADGTIGSPVAAGPESITALVRSVAGVPEATDSGAGATQSPAVPVGQPAPEIALPSLTGERVSLSDYRGEPTLVLFWSPTCGFCQRMLPALQAWEADKADDAPKALIVSSGTVAANQELGLQSTVVLDDGFGTGRAYGARGTPAAILVDAEGNIASEIAAGAVGALALANSVTSNGLGKGPDQRETAPHAHNGSLVAAATDNGRASTP